MYSVPPETLNDLNDLDLNDRKEKYYLVLKSKIYAFLS